MEPSKVRSPAICRCVREIGGERDSSLLCWLNLAAPLLTRTMDVQIFPYLMILDKNKNINTNSKPIKQTHQYKQTKLTKKKTIKCHKSKTIICNNHKKHEPKCTVLAPNHSTPPVYCVLEKYLYFLFYDDPHRYFFSSFEVNIVFVKKGQTE